MSVPTSAVELERTYEALRAQAVGEVPAFAPRGLALLRHGGVATWMTACPPLVPVSGTELPSIGCQEATLNGFSEELVRLLTEMALGRQRRCHA